jgi:mitogen-activated protein kinase kinase kinase YODA
VFGASFSEDMAPWWGKSSSKEVKKNKKTNRESIFDMIQRKLKNVSDEKSSCRLVGFRKHRGGIVSKKGSRSVSRCLSFADNRYCRPLTVPESSFPTVSNADSGITLMSKLERAVGDPTSRPSIYFPLPEPGYITIRGEFTDVEGDIVTASVSSDSSIDSGDSSDLHLVSPLVSDCENRNKATINNSFR